ARLVGEEGRGVPTIIEMANYSRIDCALGSAATTRQAVAQALHHAAHRRAFGRLLIDQPLMLNVLADLALESEAQTHLVMRLALEGPLLVRPAPHAGADASCASRLDGAFTGAFGTLPATLDLRAIVERNRPLI